jgi:hypothetical protein
MYIISQWLNLSIAVQRKEYGTCLLLQSDLLAVAELLLARE